MNKENELQYHNNWIENVLPGDSMTCRSTTHITRHISDYRGILIHDSHSMDAKVKDLLSSIKSDKGSLLDIVVAQKEELILPDPNLFDYSKDGTNYKLNIKVLPMEFNKVPCRTLLFNDHTPFYNLTKLEDKYQKIYVASVVHDVRTPIQGIMGVLETLDSDQCSATDRQLIRVGISTCKLLIFLTHDITDLGQIEGNKLQIKNEAFEVDPVIDECVQLLSFGYKKKGIQLQKIVHGSRLCAVADKHRFMQILLNLLGNALKFTLSGSVTVEVFMNAEEDLLITKVTDTGIGIKEEDMDKLFTLFGKIDSSSSLNPQGVGLGLTICKKLCKAMDGDITVQSEYKKGSTFIFTVTGTPSANGQSETIRNYLLPNIDSPERTSIMDSASVLVTK